jgi:hypothetical protein
MVCGGEGGGLDRKSVSCGNRSSSQQARGHVHAHGEGGPDGVQEPGLHLR